MEIAKIHQPLYLTYYITCAQTPYTDTKKEGTHLSSFLEIRFSELAEREGFEPPVPLSTAVFKTAGINHSPISPWL